MSLGQRSLRSLNDPLEQRLALFGGPLQCVQVAEVPGRNQCIRVILTEYSILFLHCLGEQRLRFIVSTLVPCWKKLDGETHVVSCTTSV